MIRNHMGDLAQICHDIRTPINTMMGYSMLMEQFSGDRAKINHYARRSYMLGRMVLDMADEIMDLGHIESGSVQPEQLQFSLLSMLEAVRDVIQPMADNKLQDFRVSVTNPATVEWVIGDETRLCRVLQNILSNAVKYTPEGGIVDMEVELVETGREVVHMACRVKDTGCGMSREFLDRVFEPYEREINGQNSAIPGTGLGLYIAHSFVELMGGKMTVDSEPGEGTAVMFELDFRQV